MLNFFARIAFALVLVCSFQGDGGTKAAHAGEHELIDKSHFLIGRAYRGNAFVCLERRAMDALVEAQIVGAPPAKMVVDALKRAGVCGEIPDVIWRVKSVVGSYDDAQDEDNPHTAVIVIEVKRSDDPATGEARWREGWSLLSGRVDHGDSL